MANKNYKDEVKAKDSKKIFPVRNPDDTQAAFAQHSIHAKAVIHPERGSIALKTENWYCNNCGFHFSPDQVEVTSGGCNPWPIFNENKTVTDENISISYDFLSASKEIFANWKTALKYENIDGGL